MNRKPTGWLLGMILALAIAVALSLVACGGEEDVTAAVTPEQLPRMILQREDLPEDLSYEVRPASPEAEMPVPVGRVAGYDLGAYLPHSVAKEGDLVCITGNLDLYESIGAAKTRWKEMGEWFDKAEALEPPPSEEVEWRRISVPSLADQTASYFLSARSNWCGWEDTQMEMVTVSFRKGRLWASVSTYTLEHGASSDEAIALAQKQLARIEVALEEE